VTTDSPTAGEPVSFDADASTADSAIEAYAWSFGDGANASGASAEHTYDSAGDYTVELEIETAAGVTATTATTVSVASAGNGGGGSGGSGGGGNSGGGGSGGGGGNDGSGGGSGDGGDGGGGGGNDAGGGSSGGGAGSGNTGGSGSAGSGGSSQPEEPEDPGEPSIGPANVTMPDGPLVVGDSLVVEATVTNTGDGPGTKSVEFEYEGQLVEDRELTVAPNETRTVTFTRELETPGEKTVQIDHGSKRYVTVEPRAPNISVTDLAVADRTVTAGERFDITATVANTGYAEGSERVELVLFGEVVATERVSVPAGETATVTFTREIQAAGTYDVAAGNASTSVDVIAANDATGSTTESDGDASSAPVPGFGIGAAAFALVVAVVAALRRRPE
jgi:hypothetical protein